MPGLTTGSSPNSTKTALDEILTSRFSIRPSEGVATAETADLFKIAGISGSAYIFEEFAGPGKWNKHSESEDVEETSARTGNKTTQAVDDWYQDLPIPKSYFDDQKFDLVQRAVETMGKEARNTRDENAIGVYGDGFDKITTPDGAYLWSAAHKNLNGDTIDNLESVAFSYTGFKTLQRTLFIQKNQRGRLGQHTPTAALFPPALFPTATEQLKCELKPVSAENDLSYVSMVYPDLKLYQSAWLDSAYNDYTNADTAYYVVSADHFITRKTREALNTVLDNWIHDKKRRYMYRGAFREVAFAGGWEGSVASTGV